MSVLLVLVPGAYFRPGDFAAHGFLKGLEIETVEAELPPSLYLEGDPAAWLQQNILAPARARGVDRIWLLGISLGALGALLAFQSDPADIAGMILLAPFLGTRGLIAEVAGAGGLAAWRPGEIAPADRERRMLARLKSETPPRLILGCGTEDRYADATRLLAAHAGTGIVTTEGGHDWPSWERLWSQILQTAPFSEQHQERMESACED